MLAACLRGCLYGEVIVNTSKTRVLPATPTASRRYLCTSSCRIPTTCFIAGRAKNCTRVCLQQRTAFACPLVLCSAPIVNWGEPVTFVGHRVPWSAASVAIDRRDRRRQDGCKSLRSCFYPRTLELRRPEIEKRILFLLSPKTGTCTCRSLTIARVPFLSPTANIRLPLPTNTRMAAVAVLVRIK